MKKLPQVGASKIISSVLTVNDAKQFMQDIYSVDLSKFNSIDDKAAKELAKYEGELSLDGVTNLSDKAAESLAKFEGDLWLVGLTNLSDKAASALAKHKGWLYLNGLTSLSDQAAVSLAKHENGLSLSGLTSLSDKAAEALAKHNHSLLLNGLTSLSDKAAEALAKHKDELDLSGLTSLSDKAAEALAKHEYRLLLNGALEKIWHEAKFKNIKKIKIKNAELRIEVYSRGMEIYGIKYSKSDFNKKQFLKKHSEDYMDLSDHSIQSTVHLDDSFIDIYLNEKRILTLANDNDSFQNQVQLIDTKIIDSYGQLLNLRDSEVGVWWYHDYANTLVYKWKKVSDMDLKQIQVFVFTRKDETDGSEVKLISEVLYQGKPCDDSESYGEPKTGYEGPFVI